MVTNSQSIAIAAQQALQAYLLPVIANTLRQEDLRRARFSFRQAKIVKSPWFISLRQKRVTSRMQAFSSLSVPPCCSAKAIWRLVLKITITMIIVFDISSPITLLASVCFADFAA
jgi:hypothetical protein